MKPYYAIQPAFTGGELSEDVSNRVDLDKYQLGLKQAENAIIRPYGSVRKRPGMIYCGQVKYANEDKAVLLQEFDFLTDLSYLLEFGDKYLRVWRDGVYLGIELTTPFASSELSKLRFTQSVDVMYICSGTHPVQKLSRYAEDDWEMTEVKWDMPAFCDVNKDTDCKITPSGVSGSISLRSNQDIFSADNVGDIIKIEQYVGGKSVEVKNGTSDKILVGKTWKIITHGTWTGTVWLMYSETKGTGEATDWKILRTYTSSNDYNPSESGDVEEYTYLRVTTAITSGTCTATLSSYPYTHTGYVTITSVKDGLQAQGTADWLGSTEATSEWYWQAWSKTNGYPYCATFFQDRLVLGGSPKDPQRVWMSRSGDYENFSVDKESGTVTDDSAVTADLLSRKACAINHMDAGNDLIVFTEGNSWTISGSETVTPSSITPRNQENYGVSDIPPLRVGNRVVYVQRRGSIIRDTGYDYNTDSYVGTDLTLLSKDLINGKTIIDDAFAQEPDSLLYFVRSDGVMLALTYVADQKVYAWSHFVTNGQIESVASVNCNNRDDIYVVVRRIINGGPPHRRPKQMRFIERLDQDRTSTNQQDYVMLDSAVIYSLDQPAHVITGLENLEGRLVRVLADNYLYDPMYVWDGKITLPDDVAAERLVIGLPYTMILEQPNWDAGMTADGTVQGRKKTVTKAILRLKNSFGGWIGPDAENLQEIIYDPHYLETGDKVLVTGDTTVTLHEKGVNTEGRTYIRHETPYPFTLSAIIREVTFLG